ATPNVIVDELAHLVDRLHAVDVAVAPAVAPGEQAVAAEHDPVATGMIHDRLSKHQRELEARTLPRHPRDGPSVPAVELVELLAAVRARGERDGPGGMQVIDVGEGEQRMQRRGDRRGDPDLA